MNRIGAPRLMACGHPFSARAVSVTATGPRREDRRLVTICWACAVEKELAPTERENP